MRCTAEAHDIAPAALGESCIDRPPHLCICLLGYGEEPGGGTPSFTPGTTEAGPACRLLHGLSPLPDVLLPLCVSARRYFGTPLPGNSAWMNQTSQTSPPHLLELLLMRAAPFLPPLSHSKVNMQKTAVAALALIAGAQACVTPTGITQVSRFALPVLYPPTPTPPHTPPTRTEPASAFPPAKLMA